MSQSHQIAEAAAILNARAAEAAGVRADRARQLRREAEAYAAGLPYGLAMQRQSEATQYLADRLAEAEQRLGTIASAEAQAVRQLAELATPCWICGGVTGHVIDAPRVRLLVDKLAEKLGSNPTYPARDLARDLGLAAGTSERCPSCEARA